MEEKLKEQLIKLNSEIDQQAKDLFNNPEYLMNKHEDIIQGIYAKALQEAYNLGKEDREKKEGWISVKDKMPNYYETVIVWHKKAGVTRAWLASNGDDYLWTENDTNIIISVDYWQPQFIPNPPVLIQGKQ